MNKYHRGKGEVVVPEANRLRFDACDFTQESATAEFNNHLASLTPLPDVKCPDTAPVGWLEGYVERYQVLNNGIWVGIEYWGYQSFAESDRRIFLVKADEGEKDVVELLDKHIKEVNEKNTKVIGSIVVKDEGEPLVKGEENTVSFTRTELFEFAKKLIFSYENSGNPAGELIPDCDTLINDLFK